MSFDCYWGFQSLLPNDYTKDQVIGNLRMLIRLGFTDRIVEVVNGKVLEFANHKGEIVIDELESDPDYFKNGELISAIWGDGFQGIISDKHTKLITPESASVFLPSEKNFFEQLDNIPGAPIYMDSIGNVIARIDKMMNETPPGMDDVFREKLDHYRRIFYTALRFGFVVTLSE